MEQYIPKSVVLAEIERRIADVSDECNKSKRPRFTLYGKTSALMNLHSFLDTLEVKEVDLGKEIEKCLKRHNMLAVGKKDFTDIAKYFFELGLRAQKGE